MSLHAMMAPPAGLSSLVRCRTSECAWVNLRRSAAGPSRRCYTTPTSPAAGPLKLAIIGAGPSGFYTASRILSLLPPDTPAGSTTQIHLYERLPTPYGLVRYGVAPDHPEVKNCQHKFDELSNDSRFRFFGNVLVGDSAAPSPSSSTGAISTYTYPHAVRIPLSELLPHYNALLLSYGASRSNPLSGVPGSSSSDKPLGNVFPALSFVSWYNGHPAYQNIQVDLSQVEDVTVVGQGNVALDVARILLKDVDELRKTDVPESVLDVLARSAVKRVRVVGRRGPAQVAFTTKEFREMINLPGVAYGGLSGDLLEEARQEVKGDRMRTRLLGLMEKSNGVSVSEATKHFELDFLRSPKAFVAKGDDGDAAGRVGSVEWSINELLEQPPASPAPPASQAAAVPSAPGPSASRPARVARPTSEVVTVHTDMVIESVGYRSEPLLGCGWELPFDGARGRVKNVGGRVTDMSGLAVPGVYAAGWAARGPVGVIASTMHDAYSTAQIIIDDHLTSARSTMSSSSPLGGEPAEGIPRAVDQGLAEGKVIDQRQWNEIARTEEERGRALGKPREKFVKVDEMLAAAKQSA